MRKLCAIRCIGLWIALAFLATSVRASTFVPPETARDTIDFDAGWKFIQQDVSGADSPSFDDSKWQNITTPHTYNDTDTFDEIITRGGEKSQYMGPAWYRKHFRLPAAAKGQKVFIEFEGLRNTGEIFLNGKKLSVYTNGITPHGVDLTDAVQFDGENVLAVRVVNDSRDWKDAAGNAYQWASKDFNPNFGGINRHVRLHIAPRAYFTLPLLDGLKSTGTYVYIDNVSVAEKTAQITVEAQVKNESGDQQAFDFSAVVVDAEGQLKATLTGETYDTVDGEASILKATGTLADVQFWSPERPYLYTVYAIISSGGKPIDVMKLTTGFRKTEFRGGAGKGGVYINDRFTWLTGYAQRSSNEWAGLGQAYPDWMHDYTAQLIRQSNANYVRWMHTAPQPADVRSFDKAGIVQIAPAGDKERDAEGVQWVQRVDVMKATIVYYRNSPSILFWEAGNASISPAHMKEMQEVWQKYDPHGGRVMGCRSLYDELAYPSAGFIGVMIGQDKNKDERKAPADQFRGFSEARRDAVPIIEVEDFRDEGARRFWDDYSPPHFGFKKKEEDTWNYNSESFAVAATKRYNEYVSNIITNTDSKTAKWSGYASIIFSDTISHGRQYASEVCRVSGKVDAVRIPKQIYFASRVFQNSKPDVHILGHWNYAEKTRKTVYVIANTDVVELFLNGKSLGKNEKPEGRIVFAFPDVEWQPGTLKAIASSKGSADQPAVEHELVTVGRAVAIKLTPIVGPKGLKADGADVALFDVEVVDDRGRRCTTDEQRIDFQIEGPCVWRGGYNSGTPGSTNELHLDTECGINRVAVRSTLVPGLIRLTARRDGLKQATIEVRSETIGTTPLE